MAAETGIGRKIRIVTYLALNKPAFISVGNGEDMFSQNGLAPGSWLVASATLTSKSAIVDIICSMAINAIVWGAFEFMSLMAIGAGRGGMRAV